MACGCAASLRGFILPSCRDLSPAGFAGRREIRLAGVVDFGLDLDFGFVVLPSPRAINFLLSTLRRSNSPPR